MAEVQKATNTGESAAQFIEFVMLQAQNASLFLGLIPHPGHEQPEINLPLARMFIDQLGMIQEKTRGNLSNEEGNVLRNALSNLQMAYVEVAQQQSTGSTATVPAAPAESQSARPVAEPAPAEPVPPTAGEPVDGGRENRKRFTKSYGS